MAEILVRDLDDRVVDRLKDRAREHGRSLQAEAKMILCEVADSPKLDHETALKGIVRLRERFKGRRFPDTVALIREDRDR